MRKRLLLILAAFALGGCGGPREVIDPVNFIEPHIYLGMKVAELPEDRISEKVQEDYDGQAYFTITGYPVMYMDTEFEPTYYETGGVISMIIYSAAPQEGESIRNMLIDQYGDPQIEAVTGWERWTADGGYEILMTLNEQVLLLSFEQVDLG